MDKAVLILIWFVTLAVSIGVAFMMWFPPAVVPPPPTQRELMRWETVDAVCYGRSDVPSTLSCIKK